MPNSTNLPIFEQFISSWSFIFLHLSWFKIMSAGSIHLCFPTTPFMLQRLKPTPLTPCRPRTAGSWPRLADGKENPRPGYKGVSIVMGVPQEWMVYLFHGKSHLNECKWMTTRGNPHLWTPPQDFWRLLTIYDALWRFMMIYNDLWWLRMIYDCIYLPKLATIGNTLWVSVSTPISNVDFRLLKQRCVPLIYAT